MAMLFDRDRTVIQRHIRNIYKEEELDRNITCAKFAHMGIDKDQTYVTELFNLDVIISVGYRVCPPAVLPVNFSIDYTLSHIQPHKNNFAFI